MGVSLAMSCVLGAQRDAVERCLASFVSEQAGIFEVVTQTIPEPITARLLESSGGVTFVYPSSFYDWDGASARLSVDLNASVFSFHIHDGDLWMFLLFASGKEVTKFNPIPDAWEELSASERTKWLPSADQIAIHTPLVPAARIAPYLREWSLEGLEGKANPHDKFEYTNCWQVIDFMRELGFVYPEPGQGVSYRFKVKRKR